jgi:hypothetical protein
MFVVFHKRGFTMSLIGCRTKSRAMSGAETVVLLRLCAQYLQGGFDLI